MSTSIEMKSVTQPVCIPVNTEKLFKKAEVAITKTPPPTPKNAENAATVDRIFEAPDGITPAPSLITQEPVANSHTDIVISGRLTIFSDFCSSKIIWIVYQVIALVLFNIGCAFCSLASFDTFKVNMEVNDATFYALIGICLLASAVLGAGITVVLTLYYFYFKNVQFNSKWKNVIFYVIFMIVGGFVIAASSEEIYSLILVLRDKKIVKFNNYKWEIFFGSITIGLSAGIVSSFSLDHDITSKLIAILSMATVPGTLYFLHLGFIVIEPCKALLFDLGTCAVFVAFYFIVTSERVQKFCKKIKAKLCCIETGEPATNVITV